MGIWDCSSIHNIVDDYAGIEDKEYTFSAIISHL
jgi:hypothetical protein